MSIKSNFKKGLYTSLIVAAGLFSSQEAKGQVFMPPKGDINIFQSLDTTTNAKIYNAGKTKTQRDSTMTVRFAEDWIDQIPSAENWNCDQYALETVVHSHNWGEGVLVQDIPLYNNYTGPETDLQKLYQNGGTLKDAGTLGLPTCIVSLTDDITLPVLGHSMVAILTGNDATKFEDWTFIEPQKDGINVKPGQYFFPYNCKHVSIEYPYLFKNTAHEKNYFSWKILEFEVKDGKGTLTYNINQDNTTIIPWASPDPLNKYIHLIEKRSDIIDAVKKEYTLENSVKVYPNPANDYLNIESKINEPTTIDIIISDMTGRIVENHHSNEYGNFSEQLDISKLKSGMYLINTERRTNDGKIYKETDKFVKQ